MTDIPIDPPLLEGEVEIDLSDCYVNDGMLEMVSGCIVVGPVDPAKERPIHDPDMMETARGNLTHDARLRLERMIEERRRASKK